MLDRCFSLRTTRQDWSKKERTLAGTLNFLDRLSY